MLATSTALGVEFAGGTGEPGSPYQITSAEQLVAVGNDPNLWDKHFVLIQDIDLAGVDPNRVHPIGGAPPFSGSFDGKDHIIANLRLIRKEIGWVGLFGAIGRYSDPQVFGHVRNLHLRNVNLLGEGPVGGLAGDLEAGTITNCSVMGVVAGRSLVGGLVGEVWEGEIAGCTATVEVRGNRYIGGLIGSMHGIVARSASRGCVSGQRDVGGLIGVHAGVSAAATLEGPPQWREFKQVTQCYSDCAVTGVENVGGLIGAAGLVFGIEDCYALGSVSGSTQVGGLIGETYGCGLVRCFSAGHVQGQEHTGGLIGLNEPFEDTKDLTRYPPCQLVVEKSSDESAPSWAKYRPVYRPGFVSCFWDAQVSGVAQGIGAGTDAQGGVKSLTTAQMRRSEVFQNFGWDFKQVWTIRIEESHPRLRREESSAVDRVR